MVKIDGKPIAELSVREVTKLWYYKDVGDLISFEVVRGKAREPLVIELPIIKNPAKPPAKSSGQKRRSAIIPAGGQRQQAQPRSYIRAQAPRDGRRLSSRARLFSGQPDIAPRSLTPPDPPVG